MRRKWTGNLDLNLLLKIIKRRTLRDSKTGEVSFDSKDAMFGDALAVLEFSVTFDEAIPESMYRGLTFRSVIAIAESKAFTVKAFDDELGRQERAYKMKPAERYVLTTSLSARNLSESLSHTGISGTGITFGERGGDRRHRSVSCMVPARLLCRGVASWDYANGRY